MTELDESQKLALEKIKEAISDVQTPRCDDNFLLRFLRSRHFDLEKTEVKIREALEFFEKMKADTILDEKHYSPPKLLQDYFPYCFLSGKAKDGTPLYLFHIGNCDFLGFLKSLPKEELLKYKVYLMEKLMIHLKPKGEESKLHVVRATFIVDMKGYSSRQVNKDCIKFFEELSQIEERYYPEIVEKAIIIQAPSIFPTIFNIVKGFIDPNTRKKMVFCGKDWSRTLKEYIPEEFIPKEYGGKVEKIEGVCWGGRIPKEFYKSNDESFQVVSVKAGKKHEILIEIDREGLEIQWEFATDDHDISFGLLMKKSADDKDEPVQLLETERVTSHIGSVEGSFLCEKKGVYILQFDNSFSWTKPKTLRYKHATIDPNIEIDNNLN